MARGVRGLDATFRAAKSEVSLENKSILREHETPNLRCSGSVILYTMYKVDQHCSVETERQPHTHHSRVPSTLWVMPRIR